MSCPDDDVLEALHRGEPVAASIRAHVEQCPRCAQTVTRLTFVGEASTTASGKTNPGDPRPTPIVAGHPLAIGSRIGRYVVLGEIGSGGMGVVYVAHDPELDRKVAIKLLQASTTEATHTTAAQAQLLSEAQAMARLAHPNVVSVFDVGTFDRRVFVAMEFVDGQTLREWLRERPRRQAEVREALLAAGRGLSAAHQAGLVHRDFKPDNVLVGKDGRVRVMDFGIAQALDRGAHDSEPEAAPAGAERRLEGTPAYLAPEQLDGAPANELTDQFSFGVALYEALYGVRPFKGHPLRRGPQERWVVQPPPKDRAVSPALRKIALQALAIDPAARFPTMAALLDRLSIDPLARRRKWALGSVAAMALAGIVGGYQWQLAQGRQLCRGFEERPAKLFDAARREAIRASFASSGKSFAVDSFERAERILDGYSSDWAAARTEACEATQLRGEQTEEVLSLRMICLDRRLEEWSALIDLYGRADAEIVEQSVRAALSLTPLDGCSDIAALKAPVPPPRDPEVRDRIAGLHAPFAELKALLDAGRYEEVERKGAALVERALATGYSPVAAQGLVLLGVAQSKRGNATAAETLRTAFTQAIAARDDGRAVEAITQLVRSLWERGDFPNASEWSHVGYALVERLPAHSRLRVILLHQIAGMHWRRGETDRALALLDEASAIAEGLDDAALHATLLSARAVLLDQRGNFDRSLALHRESTELQVGLYGDEHPSTLSARMNWTLALDGAGRANESIALGLANLERMKHTLGPTHQNTLGQQLSLSDSLLLLGEVEQALAFAQRAADGHAATLGPEHPRTAIAYAYLGNVLTARGRPAEARTLHERALKVLDEKVGSHSFLSLIALNGLGNALLALDRPGEALVVFERGSKLAEELKLERVDRAVAQLGVARALTMLGRDRARVKELAALAQPRLERFARVRLSETARELLASR